MNYQHYREFDFDESDRPTIFPHDSYGKFIFPVAHDSPQNLPGAGGKDWEYVCPKYIPFVSAEAEGKQRKPLFAVQWIKGGKYVLTGSSDGDII